MELIEKILVASDREPKNKTIYTDAMACIRSMGEDGLKWNPVFRGKIEHNLGYSLENKNYGMAESLYKVHRETYLFGGRYLLDDFMIGIEYDRPRGEQFYLPRRHFLKQIVDGYQDLEDEKIDFLSVSVPKRQGKSQTEILYGLFVSGKRPNNAILMEGVGTELVKSFHKGCLEYLENTEDYNYYEIFPEIKLVEQSAESKTFNLDKKSRFPTMMCRSIDSQQVGLSEATNALILDDTVAGRTEAKNRELLDEKWRVISGDIIGRAIPGTPIVITGTRYSIYDPIAHMHEWARDENKRCKIIEIPALDPVTDESNFTHMRKGKKIYDTKYFQEQRRLLSEEQFEGEFQQQPFEAKGVLFPKGELNYYYELPIDRDPDVIMAVGDTAESGSDSTSMPVGYVYGDEVYIHDVVFDNSEPKVVKPQCANILMKNKVVSVTWESNNAGEYFGRDVVEILNKAGYKINARSKRTISNKQTRIELASDGIKKNFYFKHPSTYKAQSQYDKFMKEVTTHTRSGKVPHDDGADSLSLFENELRNIHGRQITTFQRRI